MHAAVGNRQLPTSPAALERPGGRGGGGGECAWRSCHAGAARSAGIPSGRPEAQGPADAHALLQATARHCHCKCSSRAAPAMQAAGSRAAPRRPRPMRAAAAAAAAAGGPGRPACRAELLRRRHRAAAAAEAALIAMAGRVQTRNRRLAVRAGRHCVPAARLAPGTSSRPAAAPATLRRHSRGAEGGQREVGALPQHQVSAQEQRPHVMLPALPALHWPALWAARPPSPAYQTCPGMWAGHKQAHTVARAMCCRRRTSRLQPPQLSGAIQPPMQRRAPACNTHSRQA